MAMTRNILVFLASACMLYSCIGADVSENRTILSSDQENVTAQAEFASQGDNVRTVVIRSNRSWFAHLDDLDHPVDPSDPDSHVNWATLSVERHQNLTNTTDETEIVITFNENYSPNAINGVLNIWCEGRIMHSIPVTQAGRVYHVSARTDVDKAKCDSDVVSVNVDCNTKWTARVSDDSTADVLLETETGNGSGTVNLIFGENFSQTEELTAKIVFSAKGCEDFVLTISQSRAVPYVYVLPEYDGRVLGGECQASLKIRSNADWTAEVVESQFGDFTIINPNGTKGTSEPQEVKVSFSANDSGDPFNIKTAKVKFTAAGMEKPVVYEFRQRGVLTVSFEDMTAFTPEIPNTLVSASGQPTNMSRPDRINTDVDQFVYTDGHYSVSLEMSQYIRYDSSSKSLYVMGAGKIPYVKFSGIEGLTIAEVSVGCTKEGWFSGNIVSDDHVLANADKKTTEYTSLIEQTSWQTPAVGGLHYLDFDLSQSSIAEGEGCTLRTSSKNGTNDTSKKTKMYIRTVTFKYL